MKAGKGVFVEKPLALTMEELQAVAETQAKTGRRVMVGFNRRFSQPAMAVAEFFRDAGGPMTVLYRVNAGAVPEDHWLADPTVGGGRLLGEVCHFIDSIQFLSGSPVAEVFAVSLSAQSDSVEVAVRLANGSRGAVVYVAEGAGNSSKERVECFGGGKTAVIDGFRRVELADSRRTKRKRFWQQDKGHRRELELFLQSIRNGSEMPIPFGEVVNTTLATLVAQQSLCTGKPLEVQVEHLGS